MRFLASSSDTLSRHKCRRILRAVVSARISSCFIGFRCCSLGIFQERETFKFVCLSSVYLHRILLSPFTTLNMTESSQKIPIVKGKADASGAIELGGRNLAVEAAARHPVDVIQRSQDTENPFQDLSFLRATYGSGFAMGIAMERQIAAKEMKWHNNSMYADILSGHDTTLQFDDVLGLPDNRPELPQGVLHPLMAEQLK